MARAPCDMGTKPLWVSLCGPQPVLGTVVAMGVMEGTSHHRKMCLPASVQVGWGRPGSCATCPSLMSLGPKLINYLGKGRKKNINICS